MSEHFIRSISLLKSKDNTEVDVQLFKSTFGFRTGAELSSEDAESFTKKTHELMKGLNSNVMIEELGMALDYLIQ